MLFVVEGRGVLESILVIPGLAIVVVSKRGCVQADYALERLHGFVFQ